MSAKPQKIRVPTREQRDAADPTRSVWVAANAGSGKTQVLVDRIIRLLLDGADPQSILCLTYTKAAAAEMSNRLLQHLSGWSALEDQKLDESLKHLGVAPIDTITRHKARRLFSRALETPGGLKIQTIHAFCERLLQLFPVESGMAPGFRVMDDQEAKALFDQALLASLTSDNKSQMSAWDFLDDGSLSSLTDLEKLAQPFLAGTKGMRQRLSDVDRLADIQQMLKQALGITSEHSSEEITQEICDIDEAAYQRAIETLMPYEADAKHAVPLLLQKALTDEVAATRFETLAALVLTTEGKVRDKLLRKKAADSEPACAAWLAAEQQRLVDLLERLALQQTLEANYRVYQAMTGVLARINLAKREQGIYDFDDLIGRTAKLLQGNEAAQWVLYKLDKGLNHILVDEAQDTSPAQWTIIKALAGEFFTTQEKQPIPRTIFAVGDAKQSIFSFQGADTTAFETARDGFSKALGVMAEPLLSVDLSISYRSSQTVLDVVDQVFAPGQLARGGFGARADKERPHTAYHTDRVGVVELWDIERPDDDGELEHWKAPVDRPPVNHPRFKLAERIAKTIASWIGQRKLSGHDRTIAAKDILILVQKRNALFSALIAALRRHGVNVAGADRLKLQDSLIVQDLLVLGQFLRMPSDDHALACLLKSPLMPEAMSEDDVMTLALDRGDMSLWERLPVTSTNKQMLQSALGMTETPFMFFANVLQKAKRRILERLGPEAQDAAEEFLTLALDYEQKYGTSLLGFVTWLGQGETTIKREMDQSSNELRIMTVHGAKGLEAPIVFMADIADPPPRSNSRMVRWSDEHSDESLQIFLPDTAIKVDLINSLKAKEKGHAWAERLRLLYVGMTRAADELYLCGSSNNPDLSKISAESWYPHLSKVFENGEGLPGLRRVVMADGHAVLRFGAEPEKQKSPATPENEKSPVPEWATTAVVATVAPKWPMAAARASDVFDKPAIQRGLSIHRLLEHMADAKAADRVDKGKLWAQRLKLDDALVARLAAVFENEDLAPLWGPDGQSEVAIEGAVPLLGTVSGRLDRMAITGEAIYLLDYKTDQNPPQVMEPAHPYSQQMARYGALLQEAYPGRSVKVALLWTATGRLDWLSPHLLSQALDLLAKETT